jgi:hypothetical protein
MPTKIITPNVTTSLTQTDDTARQPLGTTVQLSDGGQAVYVKSSVSAVSTFAAVVIDESYDCRMLTTGGVKSGGNQVGFAQTSIATGFFGWVQLGGRPKVNLAANCAPFVGLYTTATAGVIDDATVSGSGGLLVGIFAGTSISNATAVTCIVHGGVAVPWVPIVGT